MCYILKSQVNIMNQFKSTFELGDILETIYPVLSQDVEYALIENDSVMDDIGNFCIDSKGNVRISRGIVAYDDKSEQDIKYVPRNNYGINISPWNSHSLYFEIQLPNPAEDFAFYTLIRNAMLTELKSRIDRHKKNAQARLRREATKA
jgi:hypothetical protein